MSDERSYVVKNVTPNEMVYYMRLDKEDGASLWNCRKENAMLFTFCEASLWAELLRTANQHDGYSYKIEKIQ